MMSSNDTTMDSIVKKIRSWLSSPQLNYVAILSITGILTAIGLTMVLSSSMVSSRSDDSSVWSVFINQVVFVLIGLVAAWLALQMSSQSIKRMSPWLLGIALFLLVVIMIPGVGVGGEEVGSHSWIRLGKVGIQPSELAKVALAVWGSYEITTHVRKDPSINRGGLRFLTASMAFIALILAQKDLGMMMTVGIVVLALVFFAGVQLRLLATLTAVFGVILAIATSSQGYRSDRFSTWLDALSLNFRHDSTQGSAYQTYQGLLSLSDGSFLGTGLGQSRAKWYYLPEAKNDFIFAIIGEELGWLGAGFVVLLFGLLGFFGIRTALAQADPFLAMMVATLTLGIVIQALYNISYVLGLTPMTGVQLPLISAGGTSMVITLGSLGLLANCARHEPAAISSMQHEGRSFLDRILLLPEPLPYRSGEQRRIQRRETTHHYGDPVTTRSATAGSLGHDVARGRRREGRRSELPDYDGRSTWRRREPLPPRRPTRRN